MSHPLAGPILRSVGASLAVALSALPAQATESARPSTL
jgi:hypothetical protein